jgi:hydrogenase maturation protease
MTGQPATDTAEPGAGHVLPVEVLVCGAPDRGDDGAPIAAAGLIEEHPVPDVRVRVVGQLDIDDLLAIRAGAGVVIVDAAIGIRAGHIVTLPLSGLIARDDGIHPRSSHALTFPEVVALAEFLRGRPLCGRVVVIGGCSFGLGEPFSRSVAAALPALGSAILDAVEDVRAATADSVERDTRPVGSRPVRSGS